VDYRVRCKRLSLVKHTLATSIAYGVTLETAYTTLCMLVRPKPRPDHCLLTEQTRESLRWSFKLTCQASHYDSIPRPLDKVRCKF
jgi:hypothetical protein